MGEDSMFLKFDGESSDESDDSYDAEDVNNVNIYKIDSGCCSESRIIQHILSSSG